MKLSIIVPVFNEEKTIRKVLEHICEIKLKESSKEIIVIDDGSTDNTARYIDEFRKKTSNDIKVYHQKNQGKGAAVINAVAHAKGDYIIIQDADLEYNPKDIPRLFEFIQDHKAEVVFGTRLKRMPHLLGEEHTFQFLLHYVGNRVLSLITSILYGQWVSDMETCYKLFPRKAFADITLYAKGFEFEPEITAKLLMSGYKIYEVPITTNPRGYQEGKKLNTVRDGTKALWAIFHYRFSKKPFS